MNPPNRQGRPLDLNVQLLSDARIDGSYAALLIVAAAMAALGLEQNSVATIIGAMVVAPLMLPIRALGYGVMRFDRAVSAQSLRTLAASVIMTVAIGAFIGWIARRPEFGSEILSRTNVTFLGLGVALAGGTLSGLSRALGQSTITDSLVGVGISVSLVPPLCVVGIMLAYGHWFESYGAFMIFITNLVGIALACAIVFLVTGHAAAERRRTVAGLAIFALAVGAISPALADAGYRARQLSMVEAFMAQHGKEYVPSIVAIESTTISWNRPFAIVVTLRSAGIPTKAQVRRLNEAINRRANDSYHLNVIVDPAITIAP